MDKKKADMICCGLTRKLVKVLFMPMIYGKSIISMGNDIYSKYYTILHKRECLEIACLIYKFFVVRFPGIVNLMNLVRAVSWIASYLNKPVYYETPLLRTMQDYFKSEEVSLTVYDRIQKKRRKEGIRIPSSKRDRRKTYNSTFANFIHQKDANIAAFLILDVLENNPHIPIYSVHDNFITTAHFAKQISDTYIKMFAEGPDPLYYIKKFFVRNLRMTQDSPIDLRCEIPKKVLSHELDMNIDKKDKKIWEIKKKAVIEAYDRYVKSVCYKDKDGKRKYAYNEKWNEFKDCMYRWNKLDFNYSLHL